MRLKSIKYTQNMNDKDAWFLDEFELGQINLIVGKNATGKTRTLNIIAGLANLVSGDQKLVFRSGDYEAKYTNSKTTTYNLKYELTKVKKEELWVNNERLLNRHEMGVGDIFANQLNQFIKFQSPENELACVTRRDSIQHPFFEDLFAWGKSLRLYNFGSFLGKDHLAIFMPKGKEDIEKDNFKDTNQVAGFLKKGIKRYGDILKKKIQIDMRCLGYYIDDIDVGPIQGIKLETTPFQEVEGIYVKEKDLDDVTFQHEISQGMFRALSLIIQINYSQLTSLPSCILIDDIGEGLDYDRSTALIKLLITKIKKTDIQLIMSTNDRFIMNNVPLEYWSVIRRESNRSKIFNYINSKEIFDQFEYTGLSNFDFLSTEFYLKGFAE